MENMGSARHRISSSILITSEAGLPTDPLWRRWRHLSVVVWPDGKIHSFLHEELDLLDRLDISVPWEEFLFLL
jgi:hypothetical protein